MLSSQTRIITKLREVASRNSSTNSIVENQLKHRRSCYSTGQTCTELPRKLKKTERKPWVKNINELKRIGRAERKERQTVRERILQPPENGLLVKELIPVAHQVYAARTQLFACVSKVAQRIAIYSCSVCGEVHIGHPPHKIRTCNVMGSAANKEHSWKRGASRLMQKYAVQTCGYCLEVQVGPKGHRVRNCQAYKHQMRDGQHAWMAATIDDVIPPVHVWHIQDHQSEKPLVNDLKRYYGTLPAVVELFAQAGASVPDDYARVMREDVAVPELDEEMLVV
ncbi:hypothetical protein REPUB_Repub04eG0090800 [Reevesia pubescens]